VTSRVRRCELKALPYYPQAGATGRSPEVLPFNPEKKPQGIYSHLARHQETEAGWDTQKLAAELLRWTAIFNEEFGLGVPEVSLAIDFTHRSHGKPQTPRPGICGDEDRAS
jgi:hypothetical protein